LDEVLEATRLAEGVFVGDAIEIDQNKPPLLRFMFFNQHVLVLQVTHIQTCSMEGADELGQGTKECPSLLAGARLLLCLPIDIEGGMGEQCLAHIKTLAHETGSAFLSNREGSRDCNPSSL
jgi:hypothetical protein